MDSRIGPRPATRVVWSAIQIGIATLLALGLAGCASVPRTGSNELAEIEQAMSSHIRVLASDEFGGRRPGTDGEQRTLSYLRSEFEAIGLESGTNDPANPWLAPVELVRTAATDNRIEFVKDGKRIALRSDEAFATTNLRRSLLDYAPLLFAGQSVGVRAPDELVGQVVVLLGADAKVAREREAAFDAGAAAVMQLVDGPEIVSMIRDTRSTERFRLAEETRDELTVYVTEEAFARIVGDVFFAALAAVTTADEAFVGQQLDITARIEANSQARSIRSNNLIAKLPGTKPRSGAIVLMGHWDHFGQCGQSGIEAADSLCNGAVDNASGLALMIELAKRLKAGGPYDRDIYFLATTAEEWGLLGAKAFLAEPPLPLDEIVMTFNFDSVAIAPRGTRVAFVGQGYTDIDDRVLDAIARSGRELGSQITADSFLQRQDSWAFLEAGVPALALTSGLGEETLLGRFLEERYHQASDNPDELTLGGAAEDLLLHEDLIAELASVALYPGPAE
ncbi:M20/M25/M40 family metallo-hydrolase [Altererythrobacter sp. GH1-8]|uniref:M20/M25/M40 family metallo-hydrolase n=1 Tax=Altererythrobacter sp. GH1-8 TaxID=3349333 RepID=UPI00374DA1BC